MIRLLSASFLTLTLAAVAQAECPYVPVAELAGRLEQVATQLGDKVQREYGSASWARVLVFDAAELGRIAAQLRAEADNRAPLFVLRSFLWRASELEKRLTLLVNYLTFQADITPLRESRKAITDTLAALQAAVDRLATAAVPDADCDRKLTQTAAPAAATPPDAPLLDRLRPLTREF